MTEVSQPEQRFLAAAERRIGLFILALIAPGAAVVYWGWDARTSGAFALGGAVAYGNYRWLAAMVGALARSQRSRLLWSDYARLFAPIALLGVVLYAIFSASLAPFVGVVSGVLLLVPAVFLEVMVQLVLGARR